ncbi:hypothetical protein niasHS_014253 [Heterodera schachtii]|uniref:Uncharacterized protein n=2 Tax=Heterodera TaxID=34509 RepID=A0ABD2LK78_9BILA
MPPPPPPPQAKQQQQQAAPPQQQSVEEEQQPQDPNALKIVVANVDIAQAEGNDRRTKSGKFTLAQLRATDGICPLQNGTNQFDSQKGKTGFGTPRNTQTRVEFAEDNYHGATNIVARRWRVGLSPLGMPDTEIRLQSGTNKFDSQKLMTNFGTPRDVKGKHLKRIWELEFPEEAADYQQPTAPVNAAPQQQQQAAQQQAPPNFR